MAITTGTHDIQTLLAARHTSAAEFGLDTIQQVLMADVEAHNMIVSDMVGTMCEVSTDRQRIYGTSANGDMVEVDEYGRGPTQRALPGATVGFPLKKFQFPIGWTEEWLLEHTPADMASAVENAKKAHLRQIQKQIKTAVYLSSNYSVNDHLKDNIALNIKRFVNADSADIPNGPQGQTFDGSTHTHYDATATLVNGDVSALTLDVIEHGHGNNVRIAINSADESTWKALTDFKAYEDPRIVFRNTDTPGQTLDITKSDNRAIGIIHSAEVWVKPWGIANYAFCWDAEGDKPLVFRQRESTTLQGLRIAAEHSTHPLTAQFMEASFGIGVWNRTNGAVLYFGGGSYTDPTIS